MNLFAHRRLYAIHRWILHFALRGLGFNNWKTLEESGESWVINQVLPEVLRDSSQPPLLLDVGAHSGEYAVQLLARFPNAVVHAFEPHPLTFQRLLDAVGERTNNHPVALGSKCGNFDLFDRADHDGSVRASLAREALEAVQKAPLTAHSVTVTTLDAFLAEKGIAWVDFMKIDTEGFEMDVLGGAAKSLQEGRIGAIQFEFNVLHIGRREFLADFETKLPSFRLFRILPDGLVPLDTLPPEEREIFAFQNILALPKNKKIPWK